MGISLEEGFKRLSLTGTGPTVAEILACGKDTGPEKILERDKKDTDKIDKEPDSKSDMPCKDKQNGNKVSAAKQSTVQNEGSKQQTGNKNDAKSATDKSTVHMNGSDKTKTELPATRAPGRFSWNSNIEKRRSSDTALLVNRNSKSDMKTADIKSIPEKNEINANVCTSASKQSLDKVSGSPCPDLNENIPAQHKTSADDSRSSQSHSVTDNISSGAENLPSSLKGKQGSATNALCDTKKKLSTETPKTDVGLLDKPEVEKVILKTKRSESLPVPIRPPRPRKLSAMAAAGKIPGTGDKEERRSVWLDREHSVLNLLQYGVDLALFLKTNLNILFPYSVLVYQCS